MKLHRKYFVRPPNETQEGKASMLILDRDIIGINKSSWKETTSMYVIEKIIYGCLIHEVINS